MMKNLRSSSLLIAVLGLLAAPSLVGQAQPTGPQQLAFAGLRATLQQGQFNAVASDSTGHLYLLLDQKDGVRLIKTDAAATSILAQSALGAAGDIGLAMALDPAGNIYVTGTSTSGSLTATSGAAFPTPVDTTVNAFVAKFDPSLKAKFVTFGGSSHTAPSAIAATGDAVFITGLIVGTGLPVTPSAIIQAPAAGTSQNGFVEKFSADGSKLLYATYLTGLNADSSPAVTSPAAIAADNADNAFIAGFTTATGYPTVAALVPRAVAPTSGFLTKLTPAGDGITFSTFIPGDGITSLVIDPAANNLLLSGTVALGQFPVANASSPLVNLPYQTLLRMPLDGSAVLSSTVIAPGTQSAIATGAGAVWIDGTLSFPLLPLMPLANTGTAFAVRVSPSSAPGGPVIDQVARFGGSAATNPNHASIPLTLTSVAVDSTGSAIFAGGVAPTADGSLLTTQTFDLPLADAPTNALPSSIRDAMLTPGSCTGSLCAGSAAYLARLTPVGVASLALSIDASPLIVLRNLGSVQAIGLKVTATGFTLTSTCGSDLAAGDECTILLNGAGPGRITALASNAATQTATLAAVPQTINPSTIVFSPKELDFGIQTSAGAPLIRTITVTNLGTTTQGFTSAPTGIFGRTTLPFVEDSSTCPLAGLTSSKQLAAGASCQINLSFTASSDPAKDGPLHAFWTVGSGSVALTGYAQAAALSLSSTTIDFGTQFYGGLSSPRYLYMSNNSAATITHTPVALPLNSPFTITDRCPAELEPHTICQLQFGYLASAATSTASTTLTLDQGLTVLVTGVTLPQSGTNGSTVNPDLTVSPAGPLNFANAVVVTGISSTTQTVTIGNSGNASFALSLSLTGDFTDQTDCGGSLAAGATCSVVLTFAPSQPGPRDGLLSVTAGSATTPTSVSLSGTGTPILPANNGHLDFGNISVGQPVVQWYKVSQSFSTLAAGTTSSSFGVVLVEDIGYGHGQLPPSSFRSATSGSCLNCWLGVQFTPAAEGPQTAILRLASSTSGNAYALSLTGNGVALAGVILTPVSQDFGTFAVNSSSAPSLFTLTNVTAGGVPITVNAPILTGDFSISPAPSGGTPCNGSLAVNASCFVQVVFAPTASGQRTGGLTLQTSAGTATATLTGFGSPDPGVAFNPGALVFNNVPGSAATQQSITIMNTGSSSLQVGSPSAATPAFTATSTCGTLAPGATCTVTVTYTPAVATSTDTLQVPITTTVGGGTVLTTYTVPLSATYTAENSGIQILPATANFGPGIVALLGGTRQFTINNLTAKSLALAIALPREYVLNGPSCAGLAPNASCDFSVSFLPLTNGAITGTLFAQGTPTDGSATINGLGIVQGYGTGANSLTITGNISPGRLVNFGQVPSGQGAQQVLTLTNTSSAAVATTTSTVTIRRITSQWPFLSTTTCGATLAIGDSCTVTINYTPLNQVATGTTSPAPTSDAGVLTVESDAVSGPDLIDLAGTAAPAAVPAPSNAAPLVSFIASQNSLTFDTTPIGFTSAPQFVTLANTGNTVIHITSLTASPDFTAAGACAVLVPGASCQLTITFAPQVSTMPPGVRIGAIEITSDSSNALEFLSLIGTASPSTLVFAPGALNFGTGLVGSTATLPILITNAGTTAAVFNGIATTGDYVATSTCPAPGNALAPNAACTITASFTPTAIGIRPGTLRLASSVSTSPLIAALTGVGVQSHLQVNPLGLSFSTTEIGSSTSLSLTLANTGTASITGISFATAGDYAVTAPCSFTTLSAGASCSVTVAFTPVAAGTRTGTLTISSSDPTSPNAVALTGTGSSTAVTSHASFTLTVNGAASATQTVQQTRPAAYNLTVTPLGGYAGTVVLSCNSVVAAPASVCSLLPSSVVLSGSSQSATVTVNTITSSHLQPPAVGNFRQTATFCILIPSALFFWGMRKRLPRRSVCLMLALIYASMMFMVSGCGSGGDPNLHITPAGSYQYTVTANSVGVTPIVQTVTLNLTIQ